MNSSTKCLGTCAGDSGGCLMKYRLNRQDYLRMRDKYRVSYVPGVRHGTILGYNYYGCRCISCADAIAEYWRKNNHTGTRQDYMRGCRCEGCTKANTRYMREYRKRKKPPKVRETPQCGSYTKYSKGCRCDLCRESKRLYEQNARHVRKLRNYKAGCRCEACRAENAKYMRKYRKGLNERSPV